MKKEMLKNLLSYSISILEDQRKEIEELKYNNLELKKRYAALSRPELPKEKKEK
jgi:hypothetical protein